MRRLGIIGGSIALCVILMAVYGALVSRGLVPSADEADSQSSTNTIVAEEYIHRRTTPDMVIVGSSMAQHLNADLFSGDVYNLAFAGGSVFDGLRLLVQSDMAPRVVMIETNMLSHVGDPAFGENLFRPVIFELQDALPVLREAHRPLHDVIWSAIHACRMVSERACRQTDRRINPVRDTMVAQQIANHAKALAPDVTAKRIADLKALVDVLHQRGTVTVLFEMPAHPEVCASPAATNLRRAVAEAFPTTDYEVLPAPDCSRYRTTDGTHLTDEDSRRFTESMSAMLAHAGLYPL